MVRTVKDDGCVIRVGGGSRGDVMQLLHSANVLLNVSTPTEYRATSAK